MQSLGPYRLLAELGRGGMGAVYRAQDARTGQEVALKVLLDVSPNPAQLLRFRREAEAVQGLVHPNLVACLGYSLQPPRPYAVFEFVPGETLEARVRREGPLPWEEVAELGAELAAGIAAAHERGVLHRDIKPENVLLGPLGPKLADFGLAKDLDRETLTESGATLGTPGFLAPEQIGAEKARWGETTDVYGLGATLYFALTGRPPFRGPTTIAILGQVLRAEPPSARASNPAVPGWLDALVQQCLAKLNAERPPSALAVRAALMQRPAESAPRAGRWVALGALAVGAVLAGVALASGPSAADGWEARPVGERSDVALAAPAPPEVAVVEPVAATEPASPFASAEALFAAVERHYEAEEYARALGLLEDHPAWVEASAEGQSWSAWCLLALRQVARAAEAAERAVTLDPRAGEAYLIWSMALVQRLDTLATQERASGVSPELLAQRGAYRRDLARCLPWLDRGVESDPQGDIARRRRAVARLGLGLAFDTLEDCRLGLELNPQDPVLNELRTRAEAALEGWERALLEARARSIAGDSDAAVAAYARAAQQVSPKPLEVESCARALLDDGLSELALELLERRWTELRARPEALTLRGRCALGSEGAAAGLPWLYRARALDPDHAPALKWLVAALLELEVGDSEASESARSQLRDLLEALELEATRQPGSPTLCGLRVRTYVALGRHEDAARECARGLRIHPQDGTLNLLLRSLRPPAAEVALQFASERMIERADAASVDAFLQALEQVSPERRASELTWAVRKALAFDRHGIARGLLERSPELSGSATGATLLAQCCLAQEDGVAAAAHLARALELNPDYRPAYEQLSRVYGEHLVQAMVDSRAGRPDAEAARERAQRDLTACLPWLRSALAAAPRGQRPLQRLALALMALGQLEEAYQVAWGGLQSHPGSVELREVLESARRVLSESRPTGAPWDSALTRALVANAEGREDEASELLREVRETVPREREALLACADHLLTVGRWRDALEFLRLDEAATQSTARGSTAWGRCLLLSPDGAERGLAFLELATHQDPTYSLAYEVRCNYLLKLDHEAWPQVRGLLRATASVAERALAGTPGDMVWRSYGAQIALALDDPQGARVTCLRGLAAAPDDANLLRLLHAAESQLARR